VEVEGIVGLFDAERGSGAIWTADEFNQFAARPLSEDEIARVRARRSGLFQQWFALPPGQTLDLVYVIMP
jgi:hypothetical protein